ncbi:hypothetical protein [Microlunatus soli]|uniref:Uncharacterized protein n=1 Tax=Microlunatus soli TaxID=630515 RepID=A0A1H1NAT0_9ACTN|nr:hypothetical protein [Microlunatus soli]SDR96037.1 hypothetical protein SAMN04489812_0450 [Microlunatus soli]
MTDAPVRGPAAVTRESAVFAMFADDVECRCRRRGLTIQPALVDSAINGHLRDVAELLGVTRQVALEHIAPDFGALLADALTCRS